LEKLKEGHAIYTAGACINCHGAKNIYEFPEAQWKDILDDMAQRANISVDQKDAVYKYVLAIKAAVTK
jgi:mono/diheme cytochrome c family protein